MSWQPTHELSHFVLVVALAIVVSYPPVGQLFGRPIAEEANEFYADLVMVLAGYLFGSTSGRAK